MSDTPRLLLPFLSAGQAQKELIHNEALQKLDALVCPVVNMTDGIAPPEKPAPGSCYVVPASATGDWFGYDGSLASFSSGGWRFISPFEGLEGPMHMGRNSCCVSGRQVASR